MAETLQTTLNASLNANLQNVDALLNTASFSLNQQSLLAISLATGTGAAKANLAMATQRTLASSASDSVSMYNWAFNGGSAGTDGIGAAVLFANVKILIIQNTSATESDFLSVGNDGTSAAWVSPFGANTHLVKIKGGSSLVLVDPGAAGYTVVNTTNHLLKILNSGAGSVTYNLIAIGATA